MAAIIRLFDQGFWGVVFGPGNAWLEPGPGGRGCALILYDARPFSAVFNIANDNWRDLVRR